MDWCEKAAPRRAGEFGRAGMETKYLLRMRQLRGMGTFHSRKIAMLAAISAPTVAADWGIFGKSRSESRGGSQ